MLSRRLAIALGPGRVHIRQTRHVSSPPNDGVRFEAGLDDEFIELENRGISPIDLGGWEHAMRPTDDRLTHLDSLSDSHLMALYYQFSRYLM